MNSLKWRRLIHIDSTISLGVARKKKERPEPRLCSHTCAWQGQPSSSSELTSCGAIGRKRRETRARQRRPRLPTLELEDYQHPRRVHSAAKALGHAETKWSWRETRCVLLPNPRVPRLSDAFLLGCMCLEISEPIWALVSMRRQQFQPRHVKNLTFGLRRTCCGKKNKNKIPLSSAHIYQIIIYSSQILYLY